MSNFEPDFGTPVKHKGHWVALIPQIVNRIDGLPPADAPRDLPFIYQSVTERGNIQVEMKARIRHKRFQLQSRNTTTARSHQSSDKFSTDEMRRWLDYAVRLKTVYLATFDNFYENNEYPGDPASFHSGYDTLKAPLQGSSRNEDQQPFSDGQLKQIAITHAKKKINREAEREYHEKRQRTWTVIYLDRSRGGRVRKEVTGCETKEEAWEKAEDMGLPVDQNRTRIEHGPK